MFVTSSFFLHLLSDTSGFTLGSGEIFLILWDQHEEMIGVFSDIYHALCLLVKSLCRVIIWRIFVSHCNTCMWPKQSFSFVSPKLKLKSTCTLSIVFFWLCLKKYFSPRDMFFCLFVCLFVVFQWWVHVNNYDRVLFFLSQTSRWNQAPVLFSMLYLSALKWSKRDRHYDHPNEEKGVWNQICSLCGYKSVMLLIQRNFIPLSLPVGSFMPICRLTWEKLWVLLVSLNQEKVFAQKENRPHIVDSATILWFCVHSVELS